MWRHQTVNVVGSLERTAGIKGTKHRDGGKQGEHHRERISERQREVVTDTFNGSGTQKALPTRPPVEHEATRGV